MQAGGGGGRAWVAADGNLYASGLYTLSCSMAEAAQLSFAAALAAADLADQFVESSLVTLKWPNDLLIKGAKAAGILLEARERGRGVTVVIGVGVNIASSPTGVDRPTTCLQAHSTHRHPLDADQSFSLLQAAFERWRRVWAEEGFAPLRTAWLERAHRFGAPLTVARGSQSVQGRFKDLDADGALVLDTSEGSILIRAGEIISGALTPPKCDDETGR